MPSRCVVIIESALVAPDTCGTCITRCRHYMQNGDSRPACMDHAVKKTLAMQGADKEHSDSAARVRSVDSL